MRRGACTRGSPEGASGRENRVGLLWMRTCGSRVVDYIKACARRPAHEKSAEVNEHARNTTAPTLKTLAFTSLLEFSAATRGMSWDA
jgi:hypothetical protein